jgi:hypothetical protein
MGVVEATMGLLKSKAPNLPIPPVQYDQGQQTQLNNALRLYFNQIDTANWGAEKVVAPYAMLMSNDDQDNPSITGENLVEFDTPELSNLITVENNTRIRVPYPGQYLVTFTLQVTNRGTTRAEFEVWAKNTGVNYPMSNTRFDVPDRKSSTIWGHLVPAITGIFTVNEPIKEYLEIAWWSDSLDVYLEHYAAGSSPTRPEIPSVILTINMISALP